MYFFAFFAGTGHTVYSLLPVIAEVAREVGIRPSKPLSISVIAAQHAAVASPISAPTALVLALLAPYGIESMDLLKVYLPATLAGVAVASFVASKLGKDLCEDPSYLERMQQGKGISHAHRVCTMLASWLERRWSTRTYANAVNHRCGHAISGRASHIAV